MLEDFQSKFHWRGFSMRNEAFVNTLEGLSAIPMMNFGIIHLEVREALFEPVSYFFKDDKLVRVVMLLKRISDAEFKRHVETHRNTHERQVVNGSPAAFDEVEEASHSALSMIRDLEDAMGSQF
jgi:hypothetical protein